MGSCGPDVEVGRLLEADRTGWEVLASAYEDSCRTDVPDAGYERTWQRLLLGDELHGLAARWRGELVGIAHYLFHAGVWSDAGASYLQDLYVDGAARSRGAASDRDGAPSRMVRKTCQVSTET